MDLERWNFKNWCKFCLLVLTPLFIPVIILSNIITLIPIECVQIILSIVSVVPICYIYIKHWIIGQICNNEKIDEWINK